MNAQDAALKERLATLHRDNIALTYGLGDAASGNASALAFALKNESVEGVKMGVRDMSIV
jgi:hypothetical protein